jgi:hypothetical protein
VDGSIGDVVGGVACGLPATGAGRRGSTGGVRGLTTSVWYASRTTNESRTARRTRLSIGLPRNRSVSVRVSRFGDRVQSPASPWMAACDSLNREPGGIHDGMPFERFDRVGRAVGRKAAGAATQGREQHLIGANEEECDGAQDAITRSSREGGRRGCVRAGWTRGLGNRVQG